MPEPTALIATLTESPSDERLHELAGLADILEVRADRVELDAERLRQGFPGRLLYTYRSRAEGGEGADGGDERHRRLAGAVDFDLVDLELRDLGETTRSAIPPERRLLSWHGTAESVEELAEVAERLVGESARWYKLVHQATASGPDRWPLIVLHQLGRDDLIAFAGGEVGGWTRLLSAHLGAPAVYATGNGPAGAPGQPSVEQLRRDSQWPLPSRIRDLYGIVGCPVRHSLSPYIHNRALRALDLPALYLAFHVENFGDFWLEVVEEGGFTEAGCALRGLSVTAPDKRIAMAVAGATSPLAERIASANTLVYRDGVWEADSTDAEGVLGPLRRRQLSVRGRRCAVLGAGGAGRAAAFALAGAGGEVTLFNRGSERGERAGQLLELPWAPLESFDPSGWHLIVHATPVGRQPGDPLPCDPAAVRDDAVAIDLLYLRRRPSAWVAALRERGVTAVDGREALLFQAIPQFAAMTGHEVPAELVGELLDELSRL